MDQSKDRTLILVADTAASSTATLGDIVPWAALVAATATLLVYLVGRLAEVRDRRRDSFGSAYQAARGWVEAVYRVRRRDSRTETQQQIVGHLHDLQERIDYHRGWIVAESPTMALAYDELVDCIKAACKEPLQRAWAEPPRTVENWTQADDAHPAEDENLKTADSDFRTAVRRHLSPWLLPRIWPWWHYRRLRRTTTNTRPEGPADAAQ